MKNYIGKYDTNIYSKEVVMKAAYAFIKDYYIHLSSDDDSIIVSFTAKDDRELSDNIGAEFENELLSQSVRYHVYKQTHVIREILMARAMASTMVYENDPIELFDNDSDDDLDNILEDWFKHEGISN